MINRAVRPIHFEDFSGADFERLVFAYHLREGWADLAWYGQTGSDLGRDIIGAEPIDTERRQRTVIQCVNRADLPQAKVERDMAKAAGAETGVPDAFRFVCRGTVSARRRDAVQAAGAKLGIGHVTIWSGTEFEEHLRLRAEFLLLRLVEGVTFPDAAEELKRFAEDFPGMTDAEALAMMARLFDRPAFHTPFHEEASLSAFLQAIEDTIGALNTGVWRIREGTEIRRIPAIHHLRDPRTRAAMGRIVLAVDDVRRLFKRRLADGAIRHCGCGQPECPVFFMTDAAARELNVARSQMLEDFRRLVSNPQV